MTDEGLIPASDFCRVLGGVVLDEHGFGICPVCNRRKFRTIGTTWFCQSCNQCGHCEFTFAAFVCREQIPYKWRDDPKQYEALTESVFAMYEEHWSQTVAKGEVT